MTRKTTVARTAVIRPLCEKSNGPPDSSHFMKIPFLLAVPLKLTARSKSLGWIATTCSVSVRCEPRKTTMFRTEFTTAEVVSGSKITAVCKAAETSRIFTASSAGSTWKKRRNGLGSAHYGGFSLLFGLVLGSGHLLRVRATLSGTRPTARLTISLPSARLNPRTPGGLCSISRR